jgi:hypothetical protein
MVDDTDGEGVLTNEEATGEYGTVFLALTTSGGATPQDGLAVARMPGFGVVQGAGMTRRPRGGVETGGGPGHDLNVPLAAAGAALLLVSVAFAVSAADAAAMASRAAPNHDRRRRRNLNHNHNLKPTRQRSSRLSRRGERSQEP